MKVNSVNIGSSKTLTWKGQGYTTSIFKQPVSGQVTVESLGIVGDTQSDLKVHGGRYKAVYAYPSEHYPYWKEAYPNLNLEWGSFGENLTTSGLFEPEVCIGDMYQVGSVCLKVAQPRFPCSKLAMRFHDSLMVKNFLASGKSGFYLEVVEEGRFGMGDEIKLVSKKSQTSINSFVNAYASKSPEKEIIQRILNDPDLMDDWKSFFEKKLNK